MGAVQYFSIPAVGRDVVGVAYAVQTARDPLRSTLSALGGQLQVVVRGGMHHVRGGHLVPVPPVAVVGPTSAAFDVVIAPSSHVIGCGLVPVSWIDIVGAPAGPFLDAVVDAEAVWGARRVRELADRVASCGDDDAAIAVLTGAVLSGLPDRRDARTARAREIERWIAGDAVLSLSALAARFDVSYRQLARITGEDFGCSPKLLQMKYRALKVAVALSLGDESVLAPERVEESFYDQSHLISNFQRFVGTTPVRFLDENATLSRSLLSLRWRAGARTPTTLWS